VEQEFVSYVLFEFAV